MRKAPAPMVRHAKSPVSAGRSLQKNKKMNRSAWHKLVFSGARPVRTGQIRAIWQVSVLSIVNKSQRRAVWLKRMHEWHWISSAVALLGILLFSITGFTLNHADRLEYGQQHYSSTRKSVPAELVASLKAAIEQYGEGDAEPTAPLRTWILQQYGVDTRGHLANWKKGEVYFSLERPGGDAWLKVDLDQAFAVYNLTDAGWVAYFNDLHKGRHTGAAWSWFIDVLAGACAVFAITGFVILQMHAKNRALTWPLVGFGLLVPFLIVMLFIHS
jgi:hypothetical protein